MYKIVIPSYKRSPNSPEPMRILQTDILDLNPTFVIRADDPQFEDYKKFNYILQDGKGIQNARNAYLKQFDEPIFAIDDDFDSFFNKGPNGKKTKCTAKQFFEEWNEVCEKNSENAIIGVGSFVWYNFQKDKGLTSIWAEDGCHWLNVPLLKQHNLYYDEGIIYENVDLSIRCWGHGLGVKRWTPICTHRYFDDAHKKSPTPAAYQGGTTRIDYMNNTVAKWPFLRKTDNYVRTSCSSIKKWFREHPIETNSV